jgi:hypothetical protein
VASGALVIRVINLRVFVEVSDYRSDCQLLKKDSAQFSYLQFLFY